MKSLIIANWKMNPMDSLSAVRLADEVQKGLRDVKDAEVVLCPPFLFLHHVRDMMVRFQLGAQDCFWEDEGAFTGEVSPKMLKKLGCSYVILGHSERKANLKEDSEIIKKKVEATLKAGLRPVICIGEAERGTKLGQREVEAQMRTILRDIKKVDIRKLVLVYEPEWAISTNPNAKAATPGDCREALLFMQDTASAIFGRVEADQIPFLYGGSVSAKNITDIIKAGAAGALVGGASLKASEFVQIAKNAEMQ